MENFDEAVFLENQRQSINQAKLAELLKDFSPEAKELITGLYNNAGGILKTPTVDSMLALNTRIQNKRDLTRFLMKLGLKAGSQEFYQKFDEYCNSHKLEL